jgi:hypothetical protein
MAGVIKLAFAVEGVLIAFSIKYELFIILHFD